MAIGGCRSSCRAAEPSGEWAAATGTPGRQAIGHAVPTTATLSNRRRCPDLAATIVGWYIETLPPSLVAMDRFRTLTACRAVISVVLMMLTLRMLIPVGYMPSAERALTLQLCPDGLPAQLLERIAGTQPAVGSMDHATHSMAHDPSGHTHADHHGHALHVEHCPFAASASAALTPHIASVVPVATIDAEMLAPPKSPKRAVQRSRTQQPRAPPYLC